MSSNVWEWTRSLWGQRFGEPAHKYPYDPTDVAREALDTPDDVLRVMRGGSFDSYTVDSLCAAYRYRSDPDLRLGSYGFRLVSSRLCR